MRCLLIALLLPAFTANAEMFKCLDPDGNVSFQGEPCPDNQVTEWQRETEQQKKERVQQESISAKQDEAESWMEADLPEAAEQAVLEYLNTSLKDPDSLKDFEIVETVRNDTGYRSHIRYRATNSYGAYGLDEKIAEFDAGGEMTDLREIIPYLPIQFQ